MVALSEALKVTRCPLRSLDYFTVCEAGIDMVALSEALKVTRCPLSSLHLHWSSLSPRGIMALTSALRVTSCPLDMLVDLEMQRYELIVPDDVFAAFSSARRAVRRRTGRRVDLLLFYFAAKVDRGVRYFERGARMLGRARA